MTQCLPPENETSSDKECEISSTTALTPQKKTFANQVWKPGQSGNPAGRPVGSKNKITAQKLGIEAQLRDQLNEYMPEVLQKAVEMALKGDRTMIKVLLEMTMSKAVALDDETVGKDRVQVTIRKLNIDSVQTSTPEPITVTPISKEEVNE